MTKLLAQIGVDSYSKVILNESWIFYYIPLNQNEQTVQMYQS